MGEFFKKLRKKLSASNVAEDERTIKEEDVRRTLGKVDPDSVVPVDEIASHLNDMTEGSSSPGKGKEPAAKKSSKQLIPAGILQKPTPKDEHEEEDDLSKVEGSFLD